MKLNSSSTQIFIDEPANLNIDILNSIYLMNANRSGKATMISTSLSTAPFASEDWIWFETVCKKTKIGKLLYD